jgi:hypothetical protein
MHSIDPDRTRVQRTAALIFHVKQADRWNGMLHIDAIHKSDCGLCLWAQSDLRRKALSDSLDGNYLSSSCSPLHVDDQWTGRKMTFPPLCCARHV